MTEQELKEIQARLEAATPGPWALVDRLGVIYECQSEISVIEVDANVNEGDAEFIAHAPEDIRRLLDEIDQLRNIVDKYSEANRRLRIALTNQK
jgi:phage host-nuclease inhibitor protein Gam